nr:basic proline-rich protein-like [Aegilops tauschii subsp. strangulata]
MLPILWLDFNHDNIAGSLPSELGLFCDLALLGLTPTAPPSASCTHLRPWAGRPRRGAAALTRVRPAPGQQDDRAACSPGPHPPARVAPLTLRSAALRRAPSSAYRPHHRTFGSATCSWPRALGGWAGSASCRCPTPAPSCLDHADRFPVPPPRPRRDAARAGLAPSATQSASSTTPRPHRRGYVPLAALQFQPAPPPLLLARARNRPRGARLRRRWLARGRGPAPPRIPPTSWARRLAALPSGRLRAACHMPRPPGPAPRRCPHPVRVAPTSPRTPSRLRLARPAPPMPGPPRLAARPGRRLPLAQAGSCPIPRTSAALLPLRPRCRVARYAGCGSLPPPRAGSATRVRV